MEILCDFQSIKTWTSPYESAPTTMSCEGWHLTIEQTDFKYLLVMGKFLPWSVNVIHNEQTHNFCNRIQIVESFYSVNYVNVNCSVKYSTVDREYLLFYKIFSLETKTVKKCQYSWLFEKTSVKQDKLTVELFDKKPSEN